MDPLAIVGAVGVGPALARFGTAFGASKARVDPEMAYIAGKKQKLFVILTRIH